MDDSGSFELRTLAREFAQGEIRPHAAAWDAARELPDDILRAVAEMGFLGMRMPEEDGGLALDLPTWVMVVEELSWGDASLGLTVALHNGPVAHALGTFGTQQQRERWLGRMATGEALGAFALAETDAGSDVGALVMRAVEDEDGWVLSGAKRWVTNGARAGLLVAFARTAGEAGDSGGISAFLVPGETAGISVTRRERTLGLAASETVSLGFDEVRLPLEALLGVEGEGYEMAMDVLIPGRIGVAAQSLGVAQAAFEHAVRYAGERRQFDRPIRDFGGIREKLAGMATRIAAARALTMEAAQRIEAGGGAPPSATLPASAGAQAAMAKLVASEAAMWVADEAVQVFGGYGYMRDYPVEQLMRDAKGLEIVQGSSELLRSLVADEAAREWTERG